MKRRILTGLSLFWLCSIGATAEINLFRGGNFRPVTMDGEATSAYGWNLLDHGRHFRKDKSKYLSGKDCFSLSFSENSLGFEFAKTAPKDYFWHDLRLFNTSADMPLPMAPEYRFTGAVRLDMGGITLGGKRHLKAAEGWQDFDLKLSAEEYAKTRKSIVIMKPVLPGMKVAMRNFRLEPLYPESKAKFIRLPDNGELHNLTIPADASFELKYMAIFWQSWLWRLTGTVLPIIERKTLLAVPGSLVLLGASP
ncbi:MAG: hypothetical protein JXR78_14635 [Victivallales bacterium]|nr:hypothetical protein [Victivallales bacterium]